jgi:hypothetical protein
MFKYSIIVLFCFALACSESTEKRVAVEAGVYVAANHRSSTDQAAQFMLAQYQNVLTGIGSQDTSYLLTATKSLIQMNDSLALLPLQLDSSLDQHWKIGLQNINAELNGLLSAVAIEDVKEMKLSMHMTSLQILHLLGQIGYKENTIYVFNEGDENSEDGYTWLSVQKNSKDPYHPKQRAFVSAVQVLQETK